MLWLRRPQGGLDGKVGLGFGAAPLHPVCVCGLLRVGCKWTGCRKDTKDTKNGLRYVFDISRYIVFQVTDRWWGGGGGLKEQGVQLRRELNQLYHRAVC